MDARSPTLLDIASSPAATNRDAAARHIVLMGDKLHLLAVFLRDIAAPCNPACVAPPRVPPPAGTSLFYLAIYRPAALWAYNDGILEAAPAHMPGVDPAIFAELRRWNAVLSACPHAPDELAALVFWWIAAAHRGVFDMVLAAEPQDAWARAPGVMPRLVEYIVGRVTDVSNGNPSDAPQRAVLLQAALAALTYMRNGRALAADTRQRPARVDKTLKAAMIAAHKERLRDALGDARPAHKRPAPDSDADDADDDADVPPASRRPGPLSP